MVSRAGTARAGTEGRSSREEEVPRPSGERITVALIPKATDDLQHLLTVTGMSKTDIVNRAISLYEFFQSQIDAGNDIIVRDKESGETQIVKFL